MAGEALPIFQTVTAYTNDPVPTFNFLGVMTSTRVPALEIQIAL